MFSLDVKAEWAQQDGFHARLRLALIAWRVSLLGSQSMPSFFNLYRNARNVIPSAWAARVLL